MQKKRAGMIAGGLIALIILLAFDRLIKIQASVFLKDQPPVVIIKNVFVLQYLENHGAAFGILQGRQSILIAVTVIAMAVIVFFYLRLPQYRRFVILRIILIFIAAGALGNLFDRIRQGFVIDYFYFCLINFPIFNVADIYVTVSAFLLLVLVLFYYKEQDYNEIAACFHKKKPPA